MDWILLLKILGGLATLGLGLRLGMASFRQSVDDIDRALDEDREPQRVRRHFMWLDVFVKSATSRRRRRRPFRF
jgi:hypothetical protein